MDIDQARTFLEIVRCGSLVAAAEGLFVSQTAISARVQRLEQQLGCQLFVRSRNGASLTRDGEAFIAYAQQLVHTWEAARRDLPLPTGGAQVLRLGGEVSLGNPLLLDWVSALHQALPGLSIHCEVGDGQTLLHKVDTGLLDAALVYEPRYDAGLQVEQLMEEKLVRICRSDQPAPYIYIDWGEAFRCQHDAALPELARPALSFNLGPLALQFILEHGGSGYFRTRVVQAYLDRGILQRVPQAPEFTYPTYLVYARERDSEWLQRALAVLRGQLAENRSDWSQRWDPLA
ncbi:LysR family transcriptional regulator [Pseudomonas sp. S75]|uniref:LysR family transcriptional regulator n=1 Tax=unclassified Pseudomonas TaxID=196821 RepID=UPI001907BBA5|nr:MULTISPECIES: LysR family transcriptional regulator [unclassified Pseudomonas]MBJ9976395.1 LysR family transcriptional regulator [Pseudomonas sp. S30]MBK0154493.1 LysR family transcriptional regulator [Pseudomonas sp. S75]